MTILARLGRAATAAAVFSLLAGCGRDEAGPVAVSAIGGAPRLANPSREPLDPPSAVLIQSAAQGLVRFDARGEIEPALAQRWIVSDDGLRYTFRLAKAEWSGGGRVTAEQVVGRLRAAASPASRNPLKPLLGAIDETVAMTDEVLEISLRSPRPNFLQLLAQPELGILRNGMGTGPLRPEPLAGGRIRLAVAGAEESDDGPDPSPPVELRGEAAPVAVARFETGGTDLVLGGTGGDLPLVRASRVPAAALRFDPVAGLFGLAFSATDGPFARMEARQALAMAIDRPALAAALAVPGLQIRQTVLPPGIEGLTGVSAPAWIRQPLAERRARAADVIRSLAEGGRLSVRVAMPDDPGYRLVFAHLKRDWARLGVVPRMVAPGAPADLRLVDEVAPAGLASWYLRHFSCDMSRVCDAAADAALASARTAASAAERRALLAEADRILAGLGVYIPLAAPVRWSLVAPRLDGFRPNPFARHPVGELISPRS